MKSEKKNREVHADCHKAYNNGNWFFKQYFSWPYQPYLGLQMLQNSQ